MLVLVKFCDFNDAPYWIANDLAREDSGIIEKILDYSQNLKAPKPSQVLVKWKYYEEDEWNDWLWLRNIFADNGPLQEFLRERTLYV